MMRARISRLEAGFEKVGVPFKLSGHPFPQPLPTFLFREHDAVVKWVDKQVVNIDMPYEEVARHPYADERGIFRRRPTSI